MQIQDLILDLFIFIFFSSIGLRYGTNRTLLNTMIFNIIFLFFIRYSYIDWSKIVKYTFIFYLQQLPSPSLRIIFFLIYQSMLLSHFVSLHTNLLHKLFHHYTSFCHTHVLNLVYIHLCNFFLRAIWIILPHAFGHLPTRLCIILRHCIS